MLAPASKAAVSRSDAMVPVVRVLASDKTLFIQSVYLLREEYWLLFGSCDLCLGIAGGGVAGWVIDCLFWVLGWVFVYLLMCQRWRCGWVL